MDENRDVILINLTHAGNDHASAQQLLETLWAYEGWKSEKNIDSAADFIAMAEEMRRHRGEPNADQNTTSSSMPSQERKTGSTAAPGTSGDSQTQCVVCMSSPREITLIPCGHLAVCQLCYSRLQQCPICRSLIRRAIRSYMS